MNSLETLQEFTLDAVRNIRMTRGPLDPSESTILLSTKDDPWQISNVERNPSPKNRSSHSNVDEPRQSLSPTSEYRIPRYIADIREPTEVENDVRLALEIPDRRACNAIENHFVDQLDNNVDAILRSTASKTIEDLQLTIQRVWLLEKSLKTVLTQQ